VSTGGAGSVDVSSEAVNSANETSSEDQGGLVSGGGAKADALLENLSTLASVGANATVSAGEGLSVVASATNTAGGAPAQVGSGIVTYGDSSGSAVITNSITMASIGDSARVSTGGGSILVSSQARNSAQAGASGGLQGVVAGSGARADAELNSPVTKAAIGNNVTITAPAADMRVVATSASIANAAVARKVSSFIGRNNASANATINGAENSAEVGSGSRISVAQFTLSAEDTGTNATASSKAAIRDIAGLSKATSNATTVLDTRVRIGGGTSILAPMGVTLAARDDGVISSSIAMTSAQSVIKKTKFTFGRIESVATNHERVNAEVDTDPGSSITTRYFDPRASAPEAGAGYTLDASATAPRTVGKSSHAGPPDDVVTHELNLGSTVTILGGQNQLAQAAPLAPAAGVAPVTPAELQPIIEVAIDRWVRADALDADQLARLEKTRFLIVNLPERTLGKEFGGTTVLISATAAGFGWYVDATPFDDSEFSVRLGPDAEQAVASIPAASRMDLLTVVMHELGHVIGLRDVDPGDNHGDLMDETLAPGVRRLPSATQIVEEIALPRRPMKSGFGRSITLFRPIAQAPMGGCGTPFVASHGEPSSAGASQASRAPRADARPTAVVPRAAIAPRVARDSLDAAISTLYDDPESELLPTQFNRTGEVSSGIRPAILDRLSVRFTR
jgi:hypothetical protein